MLPLVGALRPLAPSPPPPAPASHAVVCKVGLPRRHAAGGQGEAARRREARPHEVVGMDPVAQAPPARSVKPAGWSVGRVGRLVVRSGGWQHMGPGRPVMPKTCLQTPKPPHSTQPLERRALRCLPLPPTLSHPLNPPANPPHVGEEGAPTLTSSLPTPSTLPTFPAFHPAPHLKPSSPIRASASTRGVCRSSPGP